MGVVESDEVRKCAADATRTFQTEILIRRVLSEHHFSANLQFSLFDLSLETLAFSSRRFRVHHAVSHCVRSARFVGGLSFCYSRGSGVFDWCGGVSRNHGAVEKGSNILVAAPDWQVEMQKIELSDGGEDSPRRGTWRKRSGSFSSTAVSGKEMVDTASARHQRTFDLHSRLRSGRTTIEPLEKTELVRTRSSPVSRVTLNPIKAKSLNRSLSSTAETRCADEAKSFQRSHGVISKEPKMYEFALWKKKKTTKSTNVNSGGNRACSSHQIEDGKSQPVLQKSSDPCPEESAEGRTRTPSPSRVNVKQPQKLHEGNTVHRKRTSRTTRQKYKLGKLLGAGTFGKVYKALNFHTGGLFAVKKLVLDGASQPQIVALQREVRMLQKLKHENIVRYLGTDRYKRVLCIYLEYVPGGSVSSILEEFGPLSEDVIMRYTGQILRGVHYLHTRKIVHRDIKGANVLISDSGRVRLVDFGCSKQLAGLRTNSLDESLRALRGSIYYMAPEVIRQTGHSFAADIWSIGATVVEMITAKHPWQKFQDNFSALFHIATSGSAPPFPSSVSKSLESFLNACFKLTPSERSTAKDLSRHEFIRPSSSSSISSREDGKDRGDAVERASSRSSTGKARS